MKILRFGLIVFSLVILSACADRSGSIITSEKCEEEGGKVTDILIGAKKQNKCPIFKENIGTVSDVNCPCVCCK